MSIKISFSPNSIEEEKKYISYTKKLGPWLKKNGYIFNVPTIFLKKMYIQKEYDNYIKILKSRWKKEEGEYLAKLNYFFGGKINLAIIVKISRYGVGGTYFLPGGQKATVTINITAPYNHINVIKHEITHILVEPFVHKYKIKHFKKEKIVDAIF